MFACAIYPNWPEFADSVREEIVQQTRRLSPHPSLVLWCGVSAAAPCRCASPDLKAELSAQNNEAEQDSSMAHPAVWEQYHSLACAPRTF